MRRVILAVTVAVALIEPTVAHAYCRTTVCSQKKSKRPECNPGVFDGICQLAGPPLFWKEQCTSFSVQVSGSPKYNIKPKDVEELGARAFENWEAAVCSDGGNPNVYVKQLSEVDCDEVRYNTNGPNQNVWVFRDEEGLEDPQVIALTSVSFSPDSGEIYDADLEFNSRDYTFVVETPQNGGEVDLASVIQHESGHILGLAHSNVPTATMATSYGGRVEMRSLDADDFDGICAAYPPAAANTPALSTTCNAEPRHGFSTQCEGRDKDGCSCSVPGRNTSGTKPWGW
ncbi:MAG TPA: matrixin family metalloprotease, partial [Polyangiaceae bacterium]